MSLRLAAPARGRPNARARRQRDSLICASHLRLSSAPLIYASPPRLSSAPLIYASQLRRSSAPLNVRVCGAGSRRAASATRGGGGGRGLASRPPPPPCRTGAGPAAVIRVVYPSPLSESIIRVGFLSRFSESCGGRGMFLDCCRRPALQV